ncbi:MAG TPA: glycosyltransferase family 4 protein [Candidatus Aminicenantes bacterium]|nr:glycosyltransferase family 4 protein [Candidatus Aminicenantes bacterium]
MGSAPDPSSAPLTVAVCAPQVPFVTGGAEEHVRGLCAELARRGHRVELVTMPYRWYPRRQLRRSMRMWELADLRESDGRRVDLVISTKFPSYYVRHPRHVLWLIHQYRQAYDLYGTPYSDLSPTGLRGRLFRGRFVRRDTAALGRIPVRFTNSANTRDRLRRYNGLDAEPLYHPSRLAAALHCRGYGDFVLSVGRLDPLKRTDRLLRALARAGHGLRAVIAGSGPAEEDLRRLAADLGVASRVEFTGRVSDERLVELYGACLAVWFAPVDEDYGYVTLEAFGAAKPVLTCSDSGGTLEFVRDGRSGFVLPPDDPGAAAHCLDLLRQRPAEAERLGREGREMVRGITWEHAVARLLEARS